jgi:hypothetical protein
MLTTSSPFPPQSTRRADTALTLSFFRRRNDTTPRQRILLSWSALTEVFGKHQRRNEKDGAMFSPAQFKPGTRRGNTNVECVGLLVADIDNGADYEALRARLAPFNYWLWSTHSYSPENGKMRVVVDLARPVLAADWPEFWQRAQEHLFAGAMDEACKAVSEAYYLPSAAPGAPTVIDAHRGRGLDPDELPAATRKPHKKEPIGEKPWRDGERNRNYSIVTGFFRSRGFGTEAVRTVLQALNDNPLVVEAPLAATRIDTWAESSTAWWEPPDDGADCCTSPKCQAEKDGLRDRLSRFWRVKRNAALPRVAADTGLKMVYEADSAAHRLVNGYPAAGPDDWIPLNLGHPSRDECMARQEAKRRGEDVGPAPRHGWAEDLGCGPKTVRDQLIRLEEWKFCRLRREPIRIAGKEVEAITGVQLTDTSTAILDRLETFDPTVESGYIPPGRPAGLICPSCRDETKIVLEATATCSDCEKILATTEVTLAPDAPVLRVLFPREWEIAEQVAQSPVSREDAVETVLAENITARDANGSYSGKPFRWGAADDPPQTESLGETCAGPRFAWEGAAP